MCTPAVFGAVLETLRAARHECEAVQVSPPGAGSGEISAAARVGSVHAYRNGLHRLLRAVDDSAAAMSVRYVMPGQLMHRTAS